jgi:transportin-3
LISFQVTYDLAQVNLANQLALRDTLLTALETYATGPRNIVVQLSLALVGLALQVPSWDRPVQALIEKFGTNPTTVPTLLEFLTLLPDEVNSNARIPISVSLLVLRSHELFQHLHQDEEFQERSTNLLTNNAKQVLDLLLVYITATGIFWI